MNVCIYPGKARRLGFAKQETSDGRAAVYAALDELENAGYLHRIKSKNEKWQWEIEYILYEVPTPKTTVENQQRETEETIDDFPQSDFPQSENQQTNKTRNTKQEIQNSIVIWKDKTKFPKLEQKLVEFIKYRSSIKKPIKEASRGAFIQKLEKLSGWNEETAVLILENSIANGWQWIFEIKLDKAKVKKYNVWTVFADAASWF